MTLNKHGLPLLDPTPHYRRKAVPRCLFSFEGNRAFAFLATSNLDNRHEKGMDEMTINFHKKVHDTSKIRLHRTVNGQPVDIESFANTDEMIRAMSAINPNTGKAYYDESETYRRRIEEIVAATPAENLNVQLEQRSPIPTDAEMLQGLREDALRQQYQTMVEKAGGNDAIAKYNLALMLTNPSDEQRESFEGIQTLTQPEGARPYEQYLKERKASGLGPFRETVRLVEEEDQAAKEGDHNQEVLDWMDSQEVEPVEGGE